MSITITDDALPRGLIDAALATWPAADWPHWHLYDGPTGVKRATKDPARLPAAARLLIERMAERDFPGCFPDLNLHGAGLHWISAGGWLSRHLDSSVHPLNGWRRRFNAILFLEQCGGGELVIGDRLIKTAAGRLVTFETHDECWHEVRRVTAGERRTLSLFWWDLERAVNVRRQADFTEVTDAYTAAAD